MVINRNFELSRKGLRQGKKVKCIQVNANHLTIDEAGWLGKFAVTMYGGDGNEVGFLLPVDHEWVVEGIKVREEMRKAKNSGE